MAGLSDLNELLSNLRPSADGRSYVFCSSATIDPSTIASLQPLATFREAEGMTLVLPIEVAQEQGWEFDAVFGWITLNVHSDLSAVGLTAAISTGLTQAGISANVIAAYYHDHIFVPVDDVQRALDVLSHLGSPHRDE